MESLTYVERMTIKDSRMLQLYSAATPNGVKVAAMLEEIVDLRLMADQFDYEPHTVDIRHEESRHFDFLSISPNGKIPAIVDPTVIVDGYRYQSLFESGAILLYLAEKYDCLLSSSKTPLRYDTLKWFMWGATGVSSQFKLFGFYYKYCPHKLPYCIQRYEKECKRLLGVLEGQLRSHGYHWIVGNGYTIADIEVWPWIHALYSTYDNAARDVFQNFKEFPYVLEWYNRCIERPASKRSLEVCHLKF